MHSVPLEHEKQKLIFYVVQDLDQSIRSNVGGTARAVAKSYKWKKLSRCQSGDE